MAKVLVVGGAGYVGGATCAWLIERGHEVWVVDDFSTGHTQTLLAHGVLRARAGDRSRVLPLLKAQKFDCVMHFAAKALVSESVEKPELYHENNVLQTRALLEMMSEAGVKRFVFSSTCATFGDPGDRDIDESLPQKPINPYGETKLLAEKLMQEFAAKHGIAGIALRYFNAAGAEKGLRTGEWHEPESHLIPNIFKSAIEGKPLSVFGNDYPTRDGTCVRDYIHVSDLASAHEAAMIRMLEGHCTGFEAYNLGSEQGFTVLEVIQACEKVIGKKLSYEVKPRRPGDPPRLVANSKKARETLGFKVTPNSLEWIVRSAWQWEQKRRAPRKAVFLDRDGTINPDPGYISDPEQMTLYPRTAEALRLLHDQGFWLVVVSNQSGVGRGIIKPHAIPLIHQRMDDLLGLGGVQIDDYELCFCVPDSPGCDCRKPGPKMILDAAKRHGFDLSNSFMVGDKDIDVEAGWAAGCKATVQVRTGEGSNAEKMFSSQRGPSFRAETLLEAANWLVEHSLQPQK